MPFTLFHFGPALFIGLIFLGFIDFPSFLIASVIVDIEPFLVLILNLDYPLHGFFHSLLGGTLVAVPLALLMLKIRDKLTPLLSFFKLEQKISYLRIFVASLSGIYIHILFDSMMYTDIQPFYPSNFNPLLTSEIFAGLDPYIFCVYAFFGAVIVYIVRLFLLQKKIKLT